MRVAIDKQTMERMEKGKRRERKRKACCERIFSFLLLFSDKERKKSCKKIEVKCGVERRKREKRRSSFVICLQTKEKKNERKRERRNERKKEREDGNKRYGEKGKN